MKNAILLHGMPSKEEYYSEKYPSASNSHWFPWLQKQLLIHDVFAATPEVPLPFDLQWDRWAKEVERYAITPETILVGHSCGAGFWVRYLSEHRELRVGKVILVAPWIDVEKEDPNHFFDFTIDPDLASRTKGLVIINSSDDSETVQLSVTKLRDKLQDAKYVEFEGKGHFTLKSLGTAEFPELLTELV